MEINIQALIAIITTIVTLIALHIKTFNNFFLSLIKKKFGEVPGKQPMFNLILELAGYIGFILYIVISSVVFVNSILNNKPSKNNIYISIFYFCAVIIVIIIFLGAIFTMSSTMKRFWNLQDLFIEKLKGNRIFLDSDVKKKNSRGIIILAIAFVIFGIGIVGMFSSNMIIDLEKIIFFKDSSRSDINAILFTGFIEIIIGTFLVLSINMKEVIEVLANQYEYTIYTKDKDYSGFYLEFINYYLIIYDNEETYINKNEVKKITRKEIKK